MQIHELNNFTGTLGSGAYLAVDDGNDTGKLSTQQLLAATEARIDNIIAGPAPSAEEIVDARLGDDGVTYPSLGDAIRDQVGDLKSALNRISEKSKNLVSYDIEDWADLANGTYVKPTINGDSITATLLKNGTYLGIRTIIDVDGLSKVTASYAGWSGTGQRMFRWRFSSDGITWDSWVTNVSDLPQVIDTGNYKYMLFALYGTFTTSGTAGQFITYEKLQVEAGTQVSYFQEPRTAVDYVARDSLTDHFDNPFFCSIAKDFSLITGYVKYQTGLFGNTSHYKRTDFIPIKENVKILYQNGAASGEAGVAYYDRNKTYISGSNSVFSAVPDNAYYVVVSYYRSNDNFNDAFIRIYEKTKTCGIINCVGDSVTEGMNMNAQTFALYSGDNYPSHLLKMLYDNGFNYAVNNYGRSGETSLAVCAREGGRGSAYVKTNITFSGAASNIDVTGLMFSSFLDSNNQALPVHFTKGGYVSDYVWIGGHRFSLAVVGNRDYLMKVDGESTDIVIPGNKPFLIGSDCYDRNPDITIVYMGINDSDISLTQWFDRIDSIKELGGHVLTIGSTTSWWNKFTDLTGTPSDKYYQYNARVRQKLGTEFLNLYDHMTTQEGIDIALTGGYLSGRTAEQIAADDAAIASRLTPPSLTEDGTAGNVHFNDAGYYVMAKLIYEKMCQLNWL